MGYFIYWVVSCRVTKPIVLHVNFMLKKHLHEFYMKFPSNQFHGIFTYTNFIEIVFKARYYKSISYTIHMKISIHV